MMVSQYDYGYNLQLALWTNGEAVTIAAAKIVSENFTVACSVSGNVVTIPVTTSMTEQFGHFPAELRVTDSLGQVSSKNFDWFVERSPLAVKSTQTYSGDIVEFTAKRVPLNSVVVTMEPIQSGSGDPSPTNVRPITGRTGASVVVGENILQNIAQSVTRNGVTFTVGEDGTITANGTATATTVLILTNADNPVRITANQRYWLIGCPQGGSATTYELMLIQNSEGGGGLAHDYGNGASYSVTQNVIRGVQIVIRNGYTANNLIFKPRFLSATTYSITFTSAGTVYAGTVDLVSGRLEVTHGGYTFTGDETFSGQTPTTYISLNTTQFPKPMKSGAWYADEATLCSHFPKVAGNTEFGVRFGANSTYFYFYKMSEMGFTTFAEFKTWLASAGVQITYPLATPLTYTLTPTQVMSLLGENVVWSPDGEIEVVVPEYY